MSWTTSVGLIPVQQMNTNLCGPACVQMILSSMGMTQLVAGDVQPRFMNFIENDLESTIEIGSPIGLAHTINRFNTGGFRGANVPPPATEYRPVQTAMPYEGCAMIVDGLVRHHAASVAMVLRGKHWLVVYGAEGEGDPSDAAFSVRRLLLCNPDNGRFGGVNPQPIPMPESSGFMIEEITYASFISTYFDGARVGQLPQNGFIGEDGKFFIVTTSRATPCQGLRPPYPQYPPAPHEPAIEEAVDRLISCELEPILRKVERGSPRKVFRVDRKVSYYLVPLVLPDDTGQILRFDQDGDYLGRAFGTAAEAKLLYDDDAALASIRRFAATENFALDPNSLTRDDTLVWLPSAESASPYRPFDLVTRNDGQRYFVSQLGEVTTDLHERGTTDKLLIP